MQQVTSSQPSYLRESQHLRIFFRPLFLHPALRKMDTPFLPCTKKRQGLVVVHLLQSRFQFQDLGENGALAPAENNRATPGDSWLRSPGRRSVRSVLDAQSVGLCSHQVKF